MIEGLPRQLAERIRPLRDRSSRGAGEFVVYWMRTAVRAHENPALDAALYAAERLRLPVFVYHALSERYPFASDRHHRFILEGARDVELQFRERGIGYAFHLERPGNRGPFLRLLAQRAALTVTEDMPVRPLRQWAGRLAQSIATAVWLVDTACIVPMRLVGKAHDRAFAYRRATEQWREERIGSTWPSVQPRRPPFVPELPFEPIDLSTADLSSLVAQCEIDHTVGPIPHTPGGATAGYERWESFKQKRLARYAADRNDPLRNGVSRLSAYLHYGHVSPFRLAREAAQSSGAGAEKFLDELLIWRELAYTYCFYRDDHETLATIPDWARETLGAHETDPRPAIFSHESLARGKTGDPLWDAAQRSLLVHGELHNNVRMTWGKALLSWTPNPRRALELLIDLNHRYALDGRDPSSYGGILWCLGQFDRPFPPERRVLGTVRPRPTEQHARRIDVESYRRHTSRPLFSRSPRVAIVGAGLSGLVCARTLVDHGIEVVLFDKGTRPGGRLATRSSDALSYDHGAQYFTVRDPRFALRVRSWIEDGLVAEWTGRIVALEQGRPTPTSGTTRRYVGVPEMSSVAAHLAEDCNVRFGVEVRSLDRRQDGWFVSQAAGDDGPFDLVVVAVPAPQALPLLDSAPALRHEVSKVGMNGCWAVMLAFPSRLEIGFDGAFVHGSPLSWIARNGSKPARQGKTWVLHATPEWTERHLERDPEEVTSSLIEAFADATGAELPAPIDRQAHRWRFAIPDQPLDQACLFDEQNALAVCGDWCGGPRVEGAYLSGSAAAGRLLGRIASLE